MTVESGVAAGPEPLMRSRVISSVGGVPLGVAMTGSAPASPETAGNAAGSLCDGADVARLSGCEVQAVRSVRAVNAVRAIDKG